MAPEWPPSLLECTGGLTFHPLELQMNWAHFCKGTDGSGGGCSAGCACDGGG
eukprot:CAMPEP_0171912272 /NCGR_PEP_ID=MMETSP0993-20121228/10961_1 /TAXON_ID=483369 /ORGANISM="non described non described, Strain CCMP2098" /LENGTH=51 /DNA_ID=CAMNT_0012546035 /DNA_START=8 /DNA_END=159 /DNA_ORIENTATION=-